ncbi:MAG: hypothetical protein AVDCRST_MAG93-5049, partial [uncultured Chloroflexia bacterium]
CRRLRDRAGRRPAAGSLRTDPV